MSRKFEQFMKDVEEEARREGKPGLAELAAFDARFRLAGDLLALRQEHGLTQRQLADRTGIQQSEISRIEAAHANPTVATVSAIARGLGAELRVVVRRNRPGRGARKRAQRAGVTSVGRSVRRRTR